MNHLKKEVNKKKDNKEIRFSLMGFENQELICILEFSKNFFT